MRRSNCLLALLLALLLVLCGCESTAPDASVPAAETQITDDTLVASIGERHVTWAQYRMTFETYLQYYEEMGFDVFATQERLQGFQSRTVETLLEQCVLAHQAELADCDVLTDAESAALQAQIDTELAALDDVYLEQVAAEKAANPSLDEQARLRELIAAESYYYTGISMDYDSYIAYITNYYREQFFVQKLREQLVQDVTVSDAEVRSYYVDALLADQETFLADPAAYQTAAEQAQQLPPLFAPEGYARLLVVSFAAQDLNADENYVQLNEQLDAVIRQYGQLALQSAVDGVDQSGTLDVLLESYLALCRAKQSLVDKANEAARTEAERVYDSLAAGEEFSALEGVTTRYFSPAYRAAWSDELSEAIAALEPGAYTPVIQDETGCHIVYYAEPVTPGDVPFERVEAAIRSELLAQAQEAAWQAQIDAYMQDDAIVRNKTLIYAMGTD